MRNDASEKLLSRFQAFKMLPSLFNPCDYLIDRKAVYAVRIIKTCWREAIIYQKPLQKQESESSNISIIKQMYLIKILHKKNRSPKLVVRYSGPQKIDRAQSYVLC